VPIFIAKNLLFNLLKKKIRSSKLRKKIKSSRTYWHIKLFLKRISGREIWESRDIDLTYAGQGSAGWNYYKEEINADSIIYVFGIGDNIDFEIDLMKEAESEVFAFDPTPYSISWLKSIEVSKKFIFHPWALSGSDGLLTLYPRIDKKGRSSKDMWTLDKTQSDGKNFIEVPAYSVKTVLKKLEHRGIDLLKLDIEGAEYESIRLMLDSKIYPKQILVEFHHRFIGIGKRKTIECIELLRSFGYKIFCISQTGREFSFIRGNYKNE
jgi:FkbM family methyltransferase